MCMIAKEIALKKKIHDSLLIVIEQMLLVGFLKKKTPKTKPGRLICGRKCSEAPRMFPRQEIRQIKIEKKKIYIF